ncbi:MAG: TadE/TadG family type IV pilus assembly protein [Actinomycetota bacterium]
MRLRSTGRKADRGAALLEAAVVTPVFVLFVFFVLELGLLFRDSLTTDNASREGARAASTRGNEADADYYILRTVEHGLEAMGLERLDHVIVFRATGPNDTVPGSCTTASQSGLCNHYTATEFFAELDDAVGNDTGNFRCGTLDSAWCPTTRETSLAAGTDFIGIHVQTRHQFITGLFTNGQTLSETTILRLEPDEE